MRWASLLVTFVFLASALIWDAPRADAHHDDLTIEVFPHPTFQVEFSNTYGDRRSGGRRHQGIDIKSPRGTPVVAVVDGFVSRVASGELAGWHVVVTHGGGWESRYLHLNNDSPGTDDNAGGRETAVAKGIEEGSFVTAGQVIGYVGDSGNAEHTIPHTHFELRVDGDPINPFWRLRASWKRQLRHFELAGAVD